MTRKSRDRKIIFALLIAFAVQLWLLLEHTGLLPFQKSAMGSGRRAGSIQEAQNHLRRRGLNSLVWENTRAYEPVYFHDSILTLKESTATLALDTATEVKLSENTLITIEPPGEDHGGEIRLKFVRGNLQARNPFQASKIRGETWSASVKSGSDVELREVGENGIEMRVKEGSAQVNSPGGAADLTSGQILRVTAQGMDQFTVDRDLRWSDPPPRRIYLHGEAVPVPLAWSGQAEKIVIQTLGREERVFPLAPGQSRHLADLEFGQHRILLRSAAKSSAPLDVEVWRAPLIHLLQPLPRNRVDTGDRVRFLWQKSPQVQGFNFTVTGTATKITEKSEGNELSREFGAEDDVQWYVEGVDDQGFTIPPLYRYPLFIREKPLPAPKLKTPELRQPASGTNRDKGAWLWSWILPAAHAEPPAAFEAVFSWEPVAGANQYVVEISESADFREPVVNTTLTTTEFAWRGMKLQAYYWRVAAGHSGGRMGMFSDPVTVDFSALRQNPAIVALDGVLIRKLQRPVAKVAPPAPPAPAPPRPQPREPTPPPAKTGLSETQKAWRPVALWQPRYGSMLVTGTEDTEATFSGGSIPGFGFEFPWLDDRGGLWMIDAAATYYQFTPVSKATYPFQKDVGWLEYSASVLRFRSNSGYGFTAHQILSLRRADYESVTADTALGFGPIVQTGFPLARGELALRFGLIFNRDGQAVLATGEWRARLGPRLITGFGVETLILLDIPDTGYSVQGFATIGFPF